MIIRPARPDEFPYLAELWLAATKQALPFIPADELQQQVAAMQAEHLPQSDSWVIAGENPAVPPLAFISLIGRHIAALYVHPSHQGRGLGSRLLRHAMQSHRSLTLCVHPRNTDAIHFYEYHGFCASQPHAAELKMTWHAPA